MELRNSRPAAALAAALALLPAACAAGPDAPPADPAPVPAAASARNPLPPPPDSLIRRVAERVILDNPEPPSFNWGEGVLMAGMMRAHRETGDRAALEFVKAWAGRWQATLGDILEGKGPKPHGLGYCGRWGPGFPVVTLHEVTGEPAYGDMAEQVVSFFREKGTRTSDGGLGHWKDNLQLWCDTLYMTVPVLMHLGRVNSDPDLHREALAQIETYAKRLKDPATGLYYHMWDEPSGKNVGVFWCRGNGWIAMSLVEALKNLDRGSPEFGSVATSFVELADALAARQDPATGLWHTVLDHPETYLETSGSAMIVYALAEGRRLGVLPPTFADAIRRGWLGLSQQVDAAGNVIGVSVGTGPAAHEEYVHLPTASYTWGTGAFLLAACAVRGHRDVPVDTLTGRVVFRPDPGRLPADAAVLAGRVAMVVRRPEGDASAQDGIILGSPEVKIVVEPCPVAADLLETAVEETFGDQAAASRGQGIRCRLRHAEAVREAMAEAGVLLPLLPPGSYRARAVVLPSWRPGSSDAAPDTVQTFASDWCAFEVEAAKEAPPSGKALAKALEGAPPRARGFVAEYASALGLLSGPPAGFGAPPDAVTLDDHAGPPFLVRLTPGAKLHLSCRGAAVHSCRAMHYNSPVVPGREFDVGAWDRPGIHRAACAIHGQPWGWVAVER